MPVYRLHTNYDDMNLRYPKCNLKNNNKYNYTNQMYILCTKYKRRIRMIDRTSNDRISETLTFCQHFEVFNQLNFYTKLLKKYIHASCSPSI